MLDQDVLNQYLDCSTENMNEKGRRETKTLITRFFSLEPVVEASELTKDTYIQKFSQHKVMNKNSFASYKSKINDYLKWLYEQGYITNKPLTEIRDVSFSDINNISDYATYYFSDFEDLFGTLVHVFSEESADFDTFQCAAILVWHGIELKYLIDMLKTDFNEVDGYVIHPHTKEKIQILDMALPILSRYKNSEGCSSSKLQGIMIPYKKSEYLFRSYKNEYFTLPYLSYTINTPNKIAKEKSIPKQFRWTKIFESGLYDRIHQYELAHGKLSRTDFDVLKVFFNMEDIELTKQRKSVLSRKFDSYSDFIDCFY